MIIYRSSTYTYKSLLGFCVLTSSRYDHCYYIIASRFRFSGTLLKLLKCDVQIIEDAVERWHAETGSQLVHDIKKNR